MTRWSIGRWVLTIALIVGWPAAALAQEAVLIGTVTDTTGAVLPGVTVTVGHTYGVYWNASMPM